MSLARRRDFVIRKISLDNLEITKKYTGTSQDGKFTVTLSQDEQSYIDRMGIPELEVNLTIAFTLDTYLFNYQTYSINGTEFQLTNVSRGNCKSDAETLISLFTEDVRETTGLMISPMKNTYFTNKIMWYVQYPLVFKTSDHYLAKVLGVEKNQEYTAEQLSSPYYETENNTTTEYQYKLEFPNQVYTTFLKSIIIQCDESPHTFLMYDKPIRLILKQVFSSSPGDRIVVQQSLPCDITTSRIKNGLTFMILDETLYPFPLKNSFQVILQLTQSQKFLEQQKLSIEKDMEIKEALRQQEEEKRQEQEARKQQELQYQQQMKAQRQINNDYIQQINQAIAQVLGNIAQVKSKVGVKVKDLTEELKEEWVSLVLGLKESELRNKDLRKLYQKACGMKCQTLDDLVQQYNEVDYYGKLYYQGLQSQYGFLVRLAQIINQTKFLNQQKMRPLTFSKVQQTENSVEKGEDEEEDEFTDSSGGGPVNPQHDRNLIVSGADQGDPVYINVHSNHPPPPPSQAPAIDIKIPRNKGVKVKVGNNQQPPPDFPDETVPEVKIDRKDGQKIKVKEDDDQPPPPPDGQGNEENVDGEKKLVKPNPEPKDQLPPGFPELLKLLLEIKEQKEKHYLTLNDQINRWWSDHQENQSSSKKFREQQLQAINELFRFMTITASQQHDQNNLLTSLNESVKNPLYLQDLMEYFQSQKSTGEKLLKQITKEEIPKELHDQIYSRVKEQYEYEKEKYQSLRQNYQEMIQEFQNLINKFQPKNPYDINTKNNMINEYMNLIEQLNEKDQQYSNERETLELQNRVKQFYELLKQNKDAKANQTEIDLEKMKNNIDTLANFIRSVIEYEESKNMKVDIGKPLIFREKQGQNLLASPEFVKQLQEKVASEQFLALMNNAGAEKEKNGGNYILDKADLGNQDLTIEGTQISEIDSFIDAVNSSNIMAEGETVNSQKPIYFHWGKWGPAFNMTIDEQGNFHGYDSQGNEITDQVIEDDGGDKLIFLGTDGKRHTCSKNNILKQKYRVPRDQQGSRRK